MTPKVFVIDKKGKPLLPTHPARARKLLRSGKAKVTRVVPFTIQLERIIEKEVGSFVIGIDDGAKEVGIAILNKKTQEVVFRGTIKLRQDVSRKIKQRAQLRRNRRCRKLRHRKARFKNRKPKTPQPSIRQRKESIVRVVCDLKKVLNITAGIIEQGQFDVSSLAAGRQLVSTEFQQSEYEGRNFRAKVLWRDEYTCQRCLAKEKLNAHHIMGKGKGGTDTPKNGITLCKRCHDELHSGKWQLDKKPKTFKYPMHLMQGKRYILTLLKEIGLSVTRCVGWMTAYWRKKIGIEKSHSNDAIAMVTRSYMPNIVSLEYTILPKRAKVWADNPTKQRKEKLGFKHYDLVKARHRTKGWVIGSVRALKAKVMTLRTKEDVNFPVSYRKSKLLTRFNRIIYSY
ncbi:HNH endonuclease [bacterium]|nr:HNH endonuclease [bacterium]